MATPYKGGGVDQKRSSSGQNIPNRTWFFAKCPCLGGLGERLFFGFIFTFLGGQGDLFFVGCDIFQKLRIISKIADYAFEISMTIGLILQWGLSESSRSPVSVLQVEEHNANSCVASLKQIVISACTAIFAKLELDPGVEKKSCF